MNDWQNGRPVDWVNPYKRTDEKPVPDNCADEVDDAYEAGASAGIEAVINEIKKQVGYDDHGWCEVPKDFDEWLESLKKMEVNNETK